MTLLPRIWMGLILVTAVAAQAAQGLQGDYYATTSLGFGTTATRVEGPINFDYKAAMNPTLTPLPANQADNIAIRWTGQLSTTGLPTGTYTFQTASDDGMRLYVNGRLLLNPWAFRGEPNPGENATIALNGNSTYAIQVEFMQGNGGASARLRWTPAPGPAPAGQLTPIPLANLLTPPAATTNGLLQVAGSGSPVIVDLAALGQQDFVHFALAAVGDVNRKNGVNFINTWGAQGSNGATGGTTMLAPTRIANNPTGFTWTGGAPTATATNSPTSTLIVGKSDRAGLDMALGNGYGLVTPADPTERVIRVYVGLRDGTGRFEASLSDNSSPAIVDTVNGGALSSRLYTVRYRSELPNQMLALTWTMPSESAANGAVTLAAAAVNRVPVTTPLTPPVPTTPEGTPVAMTLIGTDPDGTAVTFNIITPPQFGTITPGTAAARTYTPTDPFFSGTDSFTYVVNDGVDDSQPRTVTIQVTSVNNGSPVLVDDTVSTPDNVATTVNVLANDTVVDRPFTVSIVGLPANGTAVLNPDNTITYRGNLSFVGTDTVTYQVVDVEGDTSTATLTINVTAIPPQITSPLAVNAIQNLLFTYKITAIGTLPLTYTAAPLPSGLVLVGDTIQGFVAPGSYAVTLSATNFNATDVKTLVINAISLSPNLDTDNDGFTDEFEIGVGSSPVDPNSTPFTVLRNGSGLIPPGIPPPGGLATARPFFVSNLTIKLDFRSTKLTRDAITFKGTMPVPPTFSSATQAVAANVGGITVAGTLDRRGNFTSLDKRVKIKVGKTRTSLAGANAPISVSARGVYSGAFSDEGYANVTISKAQGKVVIFVAAVTEYFSATVNTDYSARTNQSGSAKLSKIRR